jgi:hypothetical protein
MSKYHNAFQGFVKAFTAAAKPGVKGNPTTIIGVAPSKNIKKFQEQKEKIIKTTDAYKKKVNDPEIKKKMNEGTSKTLGKISQILKGKKVEKKADGGRIGRRLGGGADMAKRKTNVQKIKETFGPKKNVPNKFKGFSKLPEKVQQKINKKLAKKV